MSHYKLLFTPAKGDTGSKTEFSLSTASQISGSDSEEYINRPNKELLGEVKNVDITFALDEVTYDRQLYSPCQVTALVSVTPAQDAGQSSDLDLQDISNIFLGKTVEIRCSAKEDYGEFDSEIGRDYFVYNVKPGFVNSSKGMKCKVELTIYSRDYWLKTLKYSRSYISQKLGEDIIRKNLGDNGVLSQYKVDFDVSEKRLRNTTYKTDSGESKELIQPYHIQNNEDFYTFISRVAIRHGEYLFFENGKLTLGLDNETEAVSLDPISGSDSTKYSIVSEMYLQSSCQNPVETNTYYKNYIYNKNYQEGFDIWGSNQRYKVSNEAAGKPVEVDESKLYFNEDAFDEYFDICSLNSDSFPSTVMQQEPLGEIGIKWLFTELCPMISEFLKQRKFFGGYALLRNVVFDMVRIQVQAVRANDYFNDKYKENADINEEHEHADELKNGDFVSQFATLIQEETRNASNFMHAYYTAVREGEQAALEAVVTFKVASAVCGDVKLGAKVKYNDAEYFVTRIYGKKTTGTSEYTFIEAVPLVKVEERTDLTDDQKKENPWKAKVKMLPPYNKCYEHLSAAPQVAVVADSKDPRFLNRVRVRYPWQKADETPSVWMRVQTPFSTANGAFHFSPTEGDEVMVNYEDGNIDRPFVSGFLFNSECMPSMFPYYAPREIRTENGSRIILGRNTGNIQSYMDSVLPPASFVTPFLGPEMKDLTEKVSGKSPALAKLFGNVTLTDGFGMFEISGDTAKRQVYLGSTAGKVVIDALTGVEILAPLGDIKIKAKNIDIEAENRINIVSGLSVKDELDKRAQEKRRDLLLTNNKSEAAGFFKAAANVTVEYGISFLSELVVGKIDFSIIRSVWEAINPPMDGTLRLKSYRYMQLEAGDGVTRDDMRGFTLAKRYGTKVFEKVYENCRHVIDKFHGRLVKMKPIAIVYSGEAGFTLGKTLEEVFDYGAKDKFTKVPLKGNKDFCNSTDQQLIDSFGTMYYDADSVRMKFAVRDNVNETGRKLYKVLKPLYELYSDPKKSKTFEKFIGDGGPGHTIEDILVSCYVQTMQAIVVNGKSGNALKNMIMDYIQSDEHHVWLDDILKYWFRNIVCTVFLDEDKKTYFPAYPHYSIGGIIKNKAMVSDDEWEAVRKLVDTVEVDRLEGKPEEKHSFSVSKDKYYEVKGKYHSQLHSPSSIWGPTQRGRILISDSSDKTMGLGKDGNWTMSKNEDNLMGVRAFLASK